MPTPRRPFDLDDLITRYIAGESELALSRRLGIDRGTIRLRLEHAGIPRRSISEANRLRMARLTPAERQANAAAAQHARRGQKESWERRLRRAKTRYTHIGSGEERLATWLMARDMLMVPQYPAGPYNIDLARYPVAVEVLTGAHHPCSHGHVCERAYYLANQGWRVLYIWITPARPLVETAANEVIAFAHGAEWPPAPCGQHWVIRGSGERAPVRGPQARHRPFVPPGKADL